MDISETLAANSDQLDAVDLLGGPQTFTIESVSKGNAEQPVQVHLKEFPRPWRPGKTMRRVLVAMWCKEADQWAGRRVTLYCDPDVTFGKDRVGGTRIKAMSHIDGPKTLTLPSSRGKYATHKIDKLPDAPAPAPQRQAPAGPTPEQVAATTDVALLRQGLADFPHLRDAIEARLAELEAGE